MARCEVVLFTSLFRCNGCGPSDSGRNGVPDVLDIETDGVAGLRDEGGLSFIDDMVDILLSHDEAVFALSIFPLSPVEPCSSGVLNMSDRRPPTELCLESAGVKFCV